MHLSIGDLNFLTIILLMKTLLILLLKKNTNVFSQLEIKLLGKLEWIPHAYLNFYFQSFNPNIILLKKLLYL
jgi:hypothetical protein